MFLKYVLKAVQYAKYYISFQPYCCGGLDTYLLTLTEFPGLFLVCVSYFPYGLFRFRHFFSFFVTICFLFLPSDFIFVIYIQI